MLIFLDLETTGVGANDKICSIALLSEEKHYYSLINEQKKIPAEASAVHHITNEDIKEAPAFTQSAVYDFLKKHNTTEHTLVAHDTPFCIEKLASHGLLWQGATVDTRKVIKHLEPECEQFSLQFLRYELQLYKQEKEIASLYGIKDALCAHNALSDAVVVALLYEYLASLSSLEEMQELTFKRVLLEKFSFGKYKGRYIEEICMSDRAYVVWLLGSEIDEDIKYSINYYLEG